MAKQSVVQLVIDDQGQLQKILQASQNISKTISGLNLQFQNITVQVQNTNQQAQVVVNTFQQMLTGSNTVLHTVRKVTHSLGQWVTLISGTVMMLGAGGAFGIDRIVNSLVQRQRQAAGMGTTFGGAAAAAAGGQVGPISEQILKSIARAQGGDPQAQIALRQLQIPFKGRKPEDIEKDVLTKLPGYVAKVGVPGARVGGVTDFVGEDAVIASTTPQGRRQLDVERRTIEAVQKVRQPTEEDLRKIDDLKIAFATFTASVNTFLAKALVYFSDPLTKASGAVSDALGGNFNKMASGLGWFLDPNLGKWVDKNIAEEEAKKQTKDVGDTINKNINTPAKEFDKTMKDLNKDTGDLVKKLTTVLNNVFGGAPDGTPVSSADTSAPSAPAPSSSPPASPGSRSSPPSSPPASAPVPPPAPPPTSNPPATPGSRPPFMAPPLTKGGPRVPWLPAAPGSSGFPLPPSGPGGKSFIPGPAIPPGSHWLPLPTKPGSVPPGGFDPLQSSLPSRHQYAMNRMAPGGGNMFEKLSQHLVSRMTAEGGPMARRDGPLDVDQWQMGRTASIIVRNDHPSVHTSLAGMAG